MKTDKDRGDHAQKLEEFGHKTGLDTDKDHPYEQKNKGHIDPINASDQMSYHSLSYRYNAKV